MNRDPVEYQLAQYQRKQEEAQLRGEAIEQMAAERATEILRDPQLLRAHDHGYELFIPDNAGELYTALARCFSNLDNACKGDQIALRGITSALHILHGVLHARIAKDVDDECEKSYEAEDEDRRIYYRSEE